MKFSLFRRFMNFHKENENKKKETYANSNYARTQTIQSAIFREKNVQSHKISKKGVSILFSLDFLLHWDFFSFKNNTSNISCSDEVAERKTPTKKIIDSFDVKEHI